MSASLEWIPKATGYGVDRNFKAGAWVKAWEDNSVSRKRQNSWEEGVCELMEKSWDQCGMSWVGGNPTPHPVLLKT